MPTSHLYIFADASPSDWLVNGQEETWHTIANFIFQSDPALQSQIESGKPHTKILSRDRLFTDFINNLKVELSSGQLRKWKTSPSYRSRFSGAFSRIVAKYRPIVSACSFQEKTLRGSKDALFRSYNQLIGGIEGRGIGFEEFPDSKGRTTLKHSFVNFYGYHEILGLENQMLVLLLMAWFLADQYRFYYKDIILSGRYGFDRLAITIVSDKLSGDDDKRRKSEANLRNLIDPEGEGIPIVLTRSPHSDKFAGDLLADNLAGWLNNAISDPMGEFADLALNIATSGIWSGWYMLLDYSSQLKLAPALQRIETKSD